MRELLRLAVGRMGDADTDFGESNFQALVAGLCRCVEAGGEDNHYLYRIMLYHAPVTHSIAVDLVSYMLEDVAKLWVPLRQLASFYYDDIFY
jgi:hypothetical protein